MMGRTLRGRYTMSGITKSSKLNVTATELELTDDANRTIKYKRK
jgi:hypothetical protein